ncbi:MAG TPA: hypothetical protein VGV15_20955 [Terriglobales bacterium]|nr:hypothetical protein [Terriglobales bacterium]
MRTIGLWKTLILISMVNPSAQSQPTGFIEVSFSIDGTPANCEGFQVDLRLNGESIKPKQTGQRFEIPDAFKVPASKWDDDQRVDISLTCSGHTLAFPNQHPAFVREGDWQFGIAQPLYAVKEYGYTHEFDRGAWLGYLIFEGEPGVVTFSSQPNPPADLSEALQKEQLNASPERERDIAYMLAVLNVEYQKNRDYLLSSLNKCLSRPKESPEDDVCDGDLLSFVSNLYWRGDSALLAPLLQIAESRRDVIGDIGTLYADLLDRRGVIVLSAMGALSDDKQHLVCKLANVDDLSINSPKRERIVTVLRGAGGTAAAECLRALGNK